MSQDSSSVNPIVKDWSANLKAQIKANLSAQGMRKTGALHASVNIRFRYDSGEINRISVGAARYGWVLSNLGTKYSWRKGLLPGQKTPVVLSGKFSSVMGKNGRMYQVPQIKSYVGRKADNKDASRRDWIWSLLDQRITALADAIALAESNRVVNASSVIEKMANR